MGNEVPDFIITVNTEDVNFAINFKVIKSQVLVYYFHTNISSINYIIAYQYMVTIAAMTFFASSDNCTILLILAKSHGSWLIFMQSRESQNRASILIELPFKRNIDESLYLSDIFRKGHCYKHCS